MRQYISAVDEELLVGLVDVEANPLRELPMSGMDEHQKKRARQLALMLTMHERLSSNGMDSRSGMGTTRATI